MKPEELLAQSDFVRGLARRLLGDEGWAADVAQQTLAAALEHPPAAEKPLGAWLATVTRNFAWKLYRKESGRADREKAALAPAPPPTPDEVVAREEVRSRVVEAVLALDEPARTVLLLRFYEDLSHQEAAHRLGVPVETFRTRLKRALDKLRASLDSLYDGDRNAWCLALAPVAGLGEGLPAAVAAGGSVAAATGATSAATAAGTGGPAALLLSGKLKAAAIVLALLSVTALVILLPDEDGEAGIEAMDVTLATARHAEDGVQTTAFPARESVKSEEAAGESIEERVPVRPSTRRTVEGVLVDRETNEPLAGRTVAAVESRYWPVRRTTLPTAVTDKKGRFTLTDIPWKSCDLRLLDERLHCRGFPSVRFGQEAETKKIVLEAVRGPCLRVRVVDSRGEPAPGARLSIAKRNGGTLISHSPTYCDETGFYLLNRLEPGAQVGLIARSGASSALSRFAIVDTVLEEPQDVTLRIEGGRPLTGRVCDSGDRPLEGVRLRPACLGPKGSGIESLSLPEFIPFFDGRDESCLSGDSGEFTLHGYPPGRYRLVPDHDDFEETPIDVTIDENGKTDPEKLVLVLKRRPVLTARVVDEQGVPVKEATFRLFVRRNGGLSVDRDGMDGDEEGRIRLPRLKEGMELFALVAARGYVPTPLRKIVEREGEVTFLLKRGGRVTGHVVSPEGSPITSCSITWKPRTGEPFQDAPGNHKSLASRNPWRIDVDDTEGAFAFDGLPEGEADFVVKAIGFLPGTARALVPSGGGEAEPLRIVLEGGATLAGRVLRADSQEPIVSAVVCPCLERKVSKGGFESVEYDELFSPGSRNCPLTDGEGHFTIDNIPAGSYELRIHRNSDDQSYHAHGPIRVGPGWPAAELTILVADDKTPIEIHVFDHEGRPIEDAAIYCRSPDGVRDGFNHGIVRTDDQGVSRLEGVRPGRRKVTALVSRNDGSWMHITSEFTVLPGSNPIIELRPCTPGRGSTVSGRVVAHGNPAIDAGVRLRRDDGNFVIGAKTEKEGRFTLTGVAPGSYSLDCGTLHCETIAVSREGMSVVRNLTLDICRIAGYLVAVDGSPIEMFHSGSVRLLMKDPDEPRWFSCGFEAVDEEGRFLFPEVRPGIYAIVATARAGGERLSGYIMDVPTRMEGDGDPVVLPMERAASLTIRTTAEVSDSVTVTFLSAQGDTVQLDTRITWIDGLQHRITFESLVPGIYRIETGENGAIREVNLQAGEHRDISAP